MVYVALLRGINVGGNNKVSMTELKQVFEQAGMAEVSTYINSGNVVFISDEYSLEKLPVILEEAIVKHFGFHVKVLVLSLDEIKLIQSQLPSDWVNNDEMKSDVLFLWEEIDDPSILDKLTIKPGIDAVRYVSRALLWSVSKDHVTRSGLQKIVGTEFYRQVTVRNVNTARKIHEMMINLDERHP